MELVVNGTAQQCVDGQTVAALVSALMEQQPTQIGLSSQRVAVAVNSTVVPRSQWSITSLREGDAVELLTAVAGG